MKYSLNTFMEHDKKLVLAALDDVFKQIPDNDNMQKITLSNIRLQFGDHVNAATGRVRTVHASATLKMRVSSYIDSNILNQI